MSALSTIANQEEALLRIVGSLAGSMEQKHDSLVELGVYAQYRAIFGQYLRLLAEPEAAGEALKRAVFLSWYDLSEPACFTGLFELPSDGRYVVCGALNSAFAGGASDEELRWMVAYYYHLTESAFPGLSAHAELDLFLSRADPESYLVARFQQQQFEGRGQMGHYWRSILASHVHRAR